MLKTLLPSPLPTQFALLICTVDGLRRNVHFARQSQAFGETCPEDISLVSIDPKNLETHGEQITYAEVKKRQKSDTPDSIPRTTRQSTEMQQEV
ncbi:UNVERIFIED_CONTAM: hypothetical protein H355_002151 [Colinus virginianus]|nr:hypothetical protein H355_002151 [Colinus virginianus]